MTHSLHRPPLHPRPSRMSDPPWRSIRGAPPDWLRDHARLAIEGSPARIVDASPAILALFGVDDFEALEARLLRGEGPSARRLRHIAATLPIGDLPETRMHALGHRPAADERQFALRPDRRARRRDVAPGLDFRPWAPRAPNRLHPPTTATQCRRLSRRRRICRAERRRRIRASCGSSTRRAILALRIPCSPPRSEPTPRTAAKPSRPCSAAPNSTAAANSSASSPSGGRSPGFQSAGRSRGPTGAGWLRCRPRRCSAASANSRAIAASASWARR